MSEDQPREVEFDTSDVDRWIGVPLGGSNARYPVAEIDIDPPKGFEPPPPPEVEEAVEGEAAAKPAVSRPPLATAR